jgi:hypothetical protein
MSVDCPWSVYAADIDGDGDEDVVSASWADSYLSWWENANGIGTLWVEHVLETSFHWCQSVRAADVDGDEDIDILASSAVADEVAWFENVDGAGTIWNLHPVVTSFDSPRGICASDIDGDGDIDVVGTGNSTDIRWWENLNGFGDTWSEVVINGGFTGAVSADAADVDGDGSMDVLGAALTTGDIRWWDNSDGAGSTWVQHAINTDYSGAICVSHADIDGDGDVDVIGTAISASDVRWWDNANGSGLVWTEHVIGDPFAGAYYVCPADIDGDGDTDVLGVANTTGEVAWWENVDGTGLTWVKHTLAGAYAGASSVYAADFDGDGSIDAVGGCKTADTIPWWDLNAFPPSGSLESSILSTQYLPGWGAILWSSQTPPGTSVSFQVRASDNYSVMGAWSDTLLIPCSLAGILTDSCKYLQYRTILHGTSELATPSLQEVTFTWDAVGTGPDPTPGEVYLSPVYPNPSPGISAISFGLPEPAVVQIAVFDITGRIVQTIPAAEFQPGPHEIQMGPMASGVYFCVMNSGEFVASRRFVVVGEQ